VGQLIIPKYYNSLDKIGGTDVIVEIDESKFGKRKYNRGHSVEGVWILGMVERTEKRRVILVAIDDRTKKTLEEKITNKVYEDSSIHTDYWKGYSGLKNLFNQHLTVNHSKEFVNKETGACTNRIEGTWFAVKQQIPVRNRTNKKLVYIC
jgi:transposase-like protein